MILSDLSRAALAERERYGWMHALALAYCVVIGAFSAGAWLQQDEGLRAAICAGAQILSVVMALAARRAVTGQMFWASVGCVVIALGFSTWAAAGLTHAWTANGMPIEEWQVYFLTASEPGIFLLLEHIKEGRDTLRQAHADAKTEQDKREREASERSARLDAEAAERRAKAQAASDAPAPNVLPYKPRQRRNGARGAAAAGAAAAALSGQAVGMPPADVDVPMTDATHTAMAHAGADPRVAHACALRDKGMFRAEVAAEMGVSESTITRLWSRANRAAAEALQGAA